MLNLAFELISTVPDINMGVFCSTTCCPVPSFLCIICFENNFSVVVSVLLFDKFKALGMNEGGYKIRNQAAIHFITFAVVEWIDVFTRKDYRDILLESIRFCQKEKGLLLHSWCIMSNHLHLVASAKNEKLSGLLRDFKKFTGKQIIAAIKNNPKESRREWMLEIFKREGAKNSRNSEYQFWRQDNRPVELYSTAFIFQKMNYIHNNPVEAGIVERAEDYLYSSAKDYVLTKKCGLLDLVFL